MRSARYHVLRVDRIAIRRAHAPRRGRFAASIRTRTEVPEPNTDAPLSDGSIIVLYNQIVDKRFRWEPTSRSPRERAANPSMMISERRHPTLARDIAKSTDQNHIPKIACVFQRTGQSRIANSAATVSEQLRLFRSQQISYNSSRIRLFCIK